VSWFYQRNYSINSNMSSSPRVGDQPDAKHYDSVVRKAYLIAYNAVCAYGWTMILYHTCVDLFFFKWNYKTLYYGIGRDLRMVQSLAILEVFNSLFGMVRSPLFTTTGQVASRLFIVWFILHYLNSILLKENIAFTTLTFAWSVTEIIRYSYYMLSQLNAVPYFLTWLRYSSFLPLYPIGVASEMTLTFYSLEVAAKLHAAVFVGLSAILFMYPIGLYVLYTHMMRQRTKVLYPSTLRRAPSEITTSPKKKRL